ncbi:MAG: ABC transporter permease DevC [Leptolyngbyaceae bacterium]|nr:ABC transporter permease DevC [Leptolyngbyaceae bacterium]
MIFAIPLAWLQLTREKMRLLVALAGIGFAVILMFMQLGFRDALFDSAISLHKELQGDIVLISPQSTALIAMKSFSHRRLYQALGYEGVESISPVYLGFGLWKNPDPTKRNTRSILVIGIDPAGEVFNLPAVTQNLDQIKLSDVLLFDEASRAEFGNVEAEFKQGKTISTEIDGRRITVGGLFKLGASFGADGNVITSDLNFLRIFDRRNQGLIDVGLINLKPNANVESVIERLRGPKSTDPQKPCQRQPGVPGALPDDICVLTKQEFVAFEQDYWKSSTAIGFIFAFGTTMGFIVGTVIVYQILYTDVSDHLPEYATLKAMGYKNSYLFSLVFQEALILAVLGYIPGFALCLGLYDMIRNATSLPVMMTLERSILIFCLALVMCCISGAIAVRKAQSADPADIF